MSNPIGRSQANRSQTSARQANRAARPSEATPNATQPNATQAVGAPAADRSAAQAPAVDGVESRAPTLADGGPAAASTRAGGTGVLPFQVAQQLPAADRAHPNRASGAQPNSASGAQPNSASGVAIGPPSGPKGPPRAEVGQLLQTYGHGRLGRPAERIARWGAVIHDRISAAAAGGGGAKGVVDAMMANDLRRQVFLLEGALKFYKKGYPELEPLLVQAKQLEDVMGVVKGSAEMLELGRKAGAPAAVVDVLQKHADDAHAELVALVDPQWMPGKDGQIPAVKTLLDTMSAVDWKPYKEDKAYVRGEFDRRIKKIGKVPYRMEELQGDFGVHELRRNLRWIPIYVEALDGLVQLDDTKNPSKAYAGMLDTELANSKFMRLPDAGHEKKPIQVSKSLYAATLQLVLDYGSLKDRGEQIEEIGHAYHEAGLASSLDDGMALARDLFGFDPKENDKLTDEAAKLYSDLSANKLFKTLRKDYAG